MDLKKLYTPRQANALYNRNKIRFNPGDYSLRGNLIIDSSPTNIGNIHIAEVNTLAECEILDKLGICYDYVRHKFDCCSAGPAAADLVAYKDDNLTLNLAYLRDTCEFDMEKLSKTVFMDAYVRMFIALSSNESCVNEMFWLTTFMWNEPYDALHSFKHYKDSLAGGTDMFIVGDRQGAAIIYNPPSNHLLGVATDARAHMSRYKAVLYQLETLWAYERLNDEDSKKAIANAMYSASDEYTQTFCTIHPDHIDINANAADLIKYSNPKERFTAYQEYLKEHDEELIAEAKRCAVPYIHPFMGVFVAFGESCALTHVRINIMRILYNFAKDKGILDELYGSEDFEEHDMVKRMEIEGEVESESEESTKREKRLMPKLGKPYGHGVCASGKSDDTAALYGALDSLTSSFTANGYRYTTEDIRVTSEESKAKYNAICTKVNLINKNLIKRIKAIKTYNTGGKQPGQASGKLDKKSLYRYKQTSNIFYNNTYKQLESDLAFGVILDISGSMSGPGMENGRTTMIVLHETLKTLGINHCILGHTCYKGGHSCHIERYQSFREDKTYAVCKNYALAELKARAGNCDSGALYYMEKALERVHNKDKIVLMFSDGAPTECTGTELVNQVKAMERKGIKVIGIGINYESISRYYTDYANGRNLKDMLDIVSKILEEYVLKKVEAQ